VTVPLAVIDPLPVYRRGIAAILADQGFEVDNPADVVAWARGHRHSLVLLSVLSDDDWGVMDELCRLRPQPLVIAVTADKSGALGARAVRLGARSVLFRGADVEAVERAVVATIEGEAIMPAVVAGVVSASRPPMPATRSGLSAEQVAWLRDLSAGRTVAALAKEAGYSERAMYRFLRSVYEKLGVRTRIEAVVRMQEAGWLTSDVSSDDRAGRAD
jgi:DNA-binding NarL/FixJ family response regulator